MAKGNEKQEGTLTAENDDFNSFGFTSLLEELGNANYEEFQKEDGDANGKGNNLEVSINFDQENEKEKMFKRMTKYLTNTIRRKSKMLAPIPEKLKSLGRLSTAEEPLISPIGSMGQENTQNKNNEALIGTIDAMNKKLQKKLKSLKKENQLHIKQLEIKEKELEKYRAKLMGGLGQQTEMIDELTMQVNLLEKKNKRLNRQLNTVQKQQDLQKSQINESSIKSKAKKTGGYFMKFFKKSQKSSDSKNKNDKGDDNQDDDQQGNLVVKNTTSSEKVENPPR